MPNCTQEVRTKGDTSGGYPVKNVVLSAAFISEGAIILTGWSNSDDTAVMMVLYHTDTEQVWVACIQQDTGSRINK